MSVCDVVRWREDRQAACVEPREIKTFMKYFVCHRGHATHIIMSNVITEWPLLPICKGYVTTLQGICDDTLLL